jgi:hypothetical protein
VFAAPVAGGRSGVGNSPPPRPVGAFPLEGSHTDQEERTTNKDTRLTEDDAEELGDEGLAGLREVVENPDGHDEPADEEVEEAEEVEGVEDVEEALDVILATRFSGGHPDEFEEVDDDDIGLEGPADVVPLRRPDEFLCRACFLLKSMSQLADRSAQLCRDCA